MQPEDKICYCYGVSMRKLVNFARRTRPHVPSLMTGCLNAGTGCGWCIPFLKKIAEDPECFALDGITPDEYADRRKQYIKTAPKNKFE
jgi:NAD(P)H-nitrite reductase large subunit